MGASNRREVNRHANDAHPSSGRPRPGRRLFLGAGAAVAQTTGDESSSTTTTAQNAQPNGNGDGSGAAADCPERNNGDNGGNDNTE
jgi:hypothetical protein